MNASIHAVRALAGSFNQASFPALFAKLEPIFVSKDDFLEKVRQFDKLFEEFPEYAPVSEYLFDLLMGGHLEKNHFDERYFDTKDWLDIEDKTLERGSELLNMLLYLTEARDSEVSVELEDFLNEFLLIEEDEFQDEYRIYEELITNVELIDEDPSMIIEAANQIQKNDELKDLFLPFLLFFKQPDKELEVGGKISTLELSLYRAILAYHHNS